MKRSRRCSASEKYRTYYHTFQVWAEFLKEPSISEETIKTISTDFSVNTFGGAASHSWKFTPNSNSSSYFLENYSD
ncbi:hypothetical protein [Nostoc sp. UHCC 0251]|uniref:hypothetical protein n=1 Tax=Nostoc sp. UHCC 0251 TaxID=3110240 RepID=UPI002B1F99C2|nr:hypothetical protein [Nostoc sp. UHCC 0251]MEA5622221.1 hypothetical protein [Nostoc sp. UHCC 0251]